MVFDSAKLKVKWAEHHIANLKKSVRIFAEHNTHGTAVHENTETGDKTVVINLGQELPINFTLIASDAIHNLSAALDHANWELRGLDGGTQNRHTKLPIADDRISFEGICGGIKTPTDDLPNFFQSFEFFKDGHGHLIWALHKLDVIDKHMFLSIDTGPSIAVTIPAGTTMLEIAAFGTENKSPVKVNKNPDKPFQIFFSNVGPFQFKEVFTTLDDLAADVTRVIREFETFVKVRKLPTLRFRG